MEYIKRIADFQVEKYLEVFGAVLVEGTKWCGKTYTSQNSSKSIFYVGDPEGNFSNRTRARINPSSILAGEFPRVIDEWQEAPNIWDAVRYEVDKSQYIGQFILTGSSTPKETSKIHSGAGRIGRLKMRTMTFGEKTQQEKRVPLEDLLANKDSDFVETKLSLEELSRHLIVGGWPAARNFKEEQIRLVLNSYIANLVNVDVSSIDNIRRDPVKVIKFLESLARNVSTLVSYKTLRLDIEQFSQTDVSEQSIKEYLSILKRLFIIEEIPAFFPAGRSKIKFRKSPKRIFADSSLACNLMRINSKGLFADMKTFGLVFESQVLHDLLAHCEAHEISVSHYNDDTGVEVDAVLTDRDNNYCAVEIKLTSEAIEKAAKSLLAFKRKMINDNQRVPSSLVIIVGVGTFYHRRKDGIIVVPYACL